MEKCYGLSSQEVENSQRKHGRNVLPKPAKKSFADKLLENLKDPMIKILLVALLINVIFVYSGHSDWVETVGIFVAIMLAVLVSTCLLYTSPSPRDRG